MAEVTRGKLKGRQVTIRQFANDWFTVVPTEPVEDWLAGDTVVVSPVSLRLTPEEATQVCEAGAAGQVGTMFSEYHLRPDGTFTRIRR